MNYNIEQRGKDQKNQFVFVYNKRKQKYDNDEIGEIDDEAVSNVIDEINTSNSYIP